MDACSDHFQDTCINCSTSEFLLNTVTNGLSNRSETLNDSKERQIVINVLKYCDEAQNKFYMNLFRKQQSGVLHRCIKQLL